ncbi:unnamed protein product [Closterium sp. Naga37s-1]|nr:unnamed protein product [Closterium sp. Naga37s-1]
MQARNTAGETPEALVQRRLMDLRRRTAEAALEKAGSVWGEGSDNEGCFGGGGGGYGNGSNNAALWGDPEENAEAAAAEARYHRFGSRSDRFGAGPWGADDAWKDDVAAQMKSRMRRDEESHRAAVFGAKLEEEVDKRRRWEEERKIREEEARKVLEAGQAKDKSWRAAIKEQVQKKKTVQKQEDYDERWKRFAKSCDMGITMADVPFPVGGGGEEELKHVILHGVPKEQHRKRMREEVEDFLTSIGQINAALSLLQLELRAAADQADGGLWYGVVNRAADSQGKLGTTYSHEEIQYLKCLVEHVVTASNGSGCISSIAALHLTPAPSSSQPNPTQDPLSPSSSQPPLSPPATRTHTLSLTDKERLIADLADNHWLSISSDSRDGSSGGGSSSGGGGGSGSGGGKRGVQGSVGLGVRTYLELQQYLKSTEGVAVCDVCHDAAVKAVCCASPGCEYRLHQYCMPAKFHRVKNPKCPQCDAPWPSSEDEPAPPSQSQAAGRGGGADRRRRAGKRIVGEEEREEDREEENDRVDGERGVEGGEGGGEEEEERRGRSRGNGGIQKRAREKRKVRGRVMEEEGEEEGEEGEEEEGEEEGEEREEGEEEEEEEGEEVEEVEEEEERDVRPVRAGRVREVERVSRRTRRR